MHAGVGAGIAYNISPGMKDTERFIALTQRELEYLFRIIESSTSITQRHQFFLWAQGDVQSLLPHGMLICILDDRSGESISIEKFSRTQICETNSPSSAAPRVESYSGSCPPGARAKISHCCYPRISPIAPHTGTSPTTSSATISSALQHMECMTLTGVQAVFSHSHSSPFL